MTISFDVTREEHESIIEIAKRAEAQVFGPHLIKQTQLDTIMDISACHANGCPLKLAELLAAGDFDFAHDVAGIRRHINRTTGKLENCFLPRYAQLDNSDK